VSSSTGEGDGGFWFFQWAGGAGDETGLISIYRTTICGTRCGPGNGRKESDEAGFGIRNISACGRSCALRPDGRSIAGGKRWWSRCSEF
jgi:hypothetical protein